jgi:hypothetical protein
MTMRLWSWLWPNQAAKLERRGAPRLVAARVASCLVISLPEDVPLNVQIRNLSACGIGFTSEFALENGTFLAITLQADDGFDLSVRAQVVHATEQKDGSWLLGCALSRHLTGKELETFMGPSHTAGRTAENE